MSAAGTPPATAGGEPRARNTLLAVIGAFAVGIASMAAHGEYAFIWKTAVIPFLLSAALLTRRLDRFVEDWCVYLALIVLFDFCRGLIFAVICRFELPIYMHYVIAAERTLCGGAVLPVLLQNARAALPAPDAVDRMLTIVHGSHFAFFLLFGLALWLLRPAAFARYACAVALLLAGGLLGYALVPTVPPWMAAGNFGVLPPIDHIAAHIYNYDLPVLQLAFDVNPIAAMPSLHAALPMLCALIGARHFGRRAWPLFAYVALVCVAVGYLGEHYLVDMVVGIALAAAVYLAVYRWELLPDRVWVSPRCLRPVFLAVLIVVAAEGIGCLTTQLDSPLLITRAFAERELVGKSPLAEYYVGRLAYDAHQYGEAQRHFAVALRVLAGPSQRPEATLWYGRSAYFAGDYGAAVTALGSLQRAELTPRMQVLLALAYLRAGQGTDGEELLKQLVQQFGSDPQPLYWLTWHQYAENEIDRGQVLDVADRLRHIPNRPDAQRLRQLLLRQVQLRG